MKHLTIVLTGIPLVTALASPLVSTSANAEDTSNLSTEQRLQRLERIVESQGMVDILMRLDALQADIQKLRGEAEVAAHSIEELKRRQRELYVDIDRRLLSIERKGVAGSNVSGDMDADTSSRVTAGKPATGAVSGSSTSQSEVSPAAGQVQLTEQEAYQKAFNLLRKLKYAEAATAFNQFLSVYPEGRYAHIAQYWLGESLYAQRKYSDAIPAYQRLISNYGQSPKVAEALLKIAYSQYELKQYKPARATLEQLIGDYPGTTEAGQAENLLKKIRSKK